MGKTHLGIGFGSVFAFAVFGLQAFAGGAAVEPSWSFTYGGAVYRDIPSAWPRTTKCESTPDGARRTKTTCAREPGSGLEMTVVETGYRDLPVVEWTLSFENRGDSDTGRFTRIAPGDFSLPCADDEKVTLWRGVGEGRLHPFPSDDAGNYSYERKSLSAGDVERMGPCGGYAAWRAFPYFRLSTPKGGWTVAIGWQGQWTAEVSRVSSSVKVEARQGTVDFHLKPGEKAIAPTITVMRFADGDDAVNGWRRFMRRWILPRAKDGVRPIRPILGVDGDGGGGQLYSKMRESRHLEQIRQLKEKGVRFDIWWIDAGWYQRKAGTDGDGVFHNWFSETGDWTCDPNRFGSGSFARISDALADCGAVLTLWHEPERVSAMCGPFYERARPYLVPVEDPKCGRYDLTRADAFEFMAKAIERSVVDNKVGFYREDCNGMTTIAETWQALETRLADGRKGLVENKHIQARFRLWERLRALRPGLYFDICASGGRRNDLSTLRFPAVPLHYSDIGYTNHVMKCRYHHMCNEWMFFRKNIDYFFHTRIVNGQRMINRREAVIDLAEQHMVKASHLLDETCHAAEEREFIGAWRRVADYLVDADYYLLTPETFGEDTWWVTEFYDPAKGGGFLQVVRNPKAREDVCRVTPKGLAPGDRVRCEDLFSHREFDAVGGSALELTLKPDDGTLIAFRRLP